LLWRVLQVWHGLFTEPQTASDLVGAGQFGTSAKISTHAWNNWASFFHVTFHPVLFHMLKAQEWNSKRKRAEFGRPLETRIQK
jgi:hypothetical protein